MAPSVIPGFAVIDANVWLSAYLSSDSNHAAAYSWLEKHLQNAGLLIAPSVLLVEVTATIRRVTGDMHGAMLALNQLNRLGALATVEMDRTFVAEAAELAARLGTRATDTFYVLVARRRGIPLVTFDLDLASKVTDIVNIVTPS